MFPKLPANESSTLLELAIWKSKIVKQTDRNINLLTPDDMKMSYLIDSLSMVDIIVPNVLSFLHGDANEGNDGDGEDNDMTKTMEMKLMATMMKTMEMMNTVTTKTETITTMTTVTKKMEMETMNTNVKSKVRYSKLIGCLLVCFVVGT